MSTIGFLHTSPVHEPTFRARVRHTPGGEGFDQMHRVDESLLADARAIGLDDDLRGRLRTHLQALGHADVVLCTCSTIGGEAERIASDLGGG